MPDAAFLKISDAKLEFLILESGLIGICFQNC